jgi:phage gpG-like protein
VRGLSELARALRGFTPAVVRDLGPAGERVAQVAASAAAGTTPRVSGALAGSLTVERGQGDVIGAVGYGEPYGGWVEYGGGRGRAYVPEGRYLGPASRGAASVLEDETAQAIRVTIGGYSWPVASKA